MPTRTIVFIHGNFVGRHCWEQWVDRFETRGYTCHAIAYPGRDLPVPTLRKKHPDPELSRLSLRDVINHHVKFIQSLKEKPIVIGHSFGGLLTQLMVQRDLAAAAVAIDSVPPPGVIALKWSFYRSVLPVLNPFAGSRPYLMPFRHFQYTFVNGLPPAEQRRAYDAEVVPESRRVARGGLGSDAKVDFKRRHAPLLMIGGELDNIMPAAVNRQNWKKYGKSSSITEYKEFPGRTHYIIGQRGWEEVADYALAWAEQQTGTTRTAEPLRAVQSPVH